jgi:hypothetical protein
MRRCGVVPGGAGWVPRSTCRRPCGIVVLYPADPDAVADDRHGWLPQLALALGGLEFLEPFLQADRLGLYRRKEGEEPIPVLYAGRHSGAVAERPPVPRQVCGTHVGVVAEVDREPVLAEKEPPFGHPALRVQADERRVGPVRGKCNSRGCGASSGVVGGGLGGEWRGVPAAV